MFPSLFENLSHWRRRRSAVEADAVHAPLADETALRELSLLAEALPAFESLRPSAHPWSGERRSLHRGRGFEFEENRAYQPGDEPRLMNWRLYARSGELHTKVFSEERRRQMVVVLDRRAAMRFGTRRQLKAALAAKIGVCYAYAAQRQGMAVGGLLLNQAAEWFAPAVGEVALHGLVHEMTAACPPLAFDADQPAFEQGLQLLLTRLPAGCLVLLLSDFRDLDPDGVADKLHRLAMLHTVQAVQILDPIERSLPPTGSFSLADAAGQRPLRIDARDRGQRSSYAQLFDERRTRLAECFAGCGIDLRVATTLDDASTCLGLSA